MVLADPAAAADLIAAPALVTTATEYYDRGDFFTEVRLGAAFSADGRERVHEDGLFVEGEVLFVPIPGRYGHWLVESLLLPRPHVGATLSTDGGTQQVYAGLTWNVPLAEIFFLEASFGGTIHDRGLDLGHDDGAELGCHLLFRESAGIGVRLGPHWRLVTSVDHSSNAGLCDAGNDGLTHVGTALGYRF
jgi:hypothetical protein